MPSESHHPNPESLTRRRFIRKGAGAVGTLAGVHSLKAEASDTIRVGIVGGGAAGSELCRALRMIPGVSISAVCDIHRIRANTVARAVGAGNVSATLEEMLKQAGDLLDAVVIAAPCWLHAPFTRAALEAGKHVYCVKQMAHSAEAARDMVRAQRQTGKLLQIGLQRRSNPHYIHLRDRIIREWKLTGKITHLFSQWHRGIKPMLEPRVPEDTVRAIQAAGYPDVFEYANWRWFSRYGGGPVADLGGQQIDVFNMLLGVPPRAVIASGGTAVFGNFEYAPGKRMRSDQLDNAVAVFEYDTPEHGVVRAECRVIATGGGLHFCETVSGTEATVQISELEGGVFGFRNRIWRESETTVEKTSHWLRAAEAGVMTRPLAPPPDWHELEMAFPPLPAEVEKKHPSQHHLENFFHAIRTGAKQESLNCPAEEGFRNMVAIEALKTSVREQRRVEIRPEDYLVS